MKNPHAIHSPDKSQSPIERILVPFLTPRKHTAAMKLILIDAIKLNSTIPEIEKKIYALDILDGFSYLAQSMVIAGYQITKNKK